MGEIIRPDFSRLKKEEPKEAVEEAKIEVTSLPAKMTSTEKEESTASFGVVLGEEHDPLLFEYIELAHSDKIKNFQI